jgi:two-component system cell cycle response regulator
MSVKSKVLMIDDARAMHAVVKVRLAAEAIELHSAFDGRTGIELAASVQPDIILLDVEMPSPNGFEVCQMLKGNADLSNIPVIFLTGASSTEEKVRGLNLGAIDYVTKPFDAAELQARVGAGLRMKELLDLLSRKAMIDGLTGLYNRGHLNQRLAEEIAHSKRHDRPLSCVMLDVDHFKTINDTHGHGFGDFVLKEIAGVVHHVSRREDIACRYGGEEFAILARETTGDAAMMFAERLRAGIEAAVCHRGAISTKVTCSVGVSEFVSGVDDLVDRADRALYQSKQAGRNRVTRFESQAPIAAAA